MSIFNKMVKAIDDCNLDDLDTEIEKILVGKQCGRVVVNML